MFLPYISSKKICKLYALIIFICDSLRLLIGQYAVSFGSFKSSTFRDTVFYRYCIVMKKTLIMIFVKRYSFPGSLYEQKLLEAIKEDIINALSGAYVCDE